MEKSDWIGYGTLDPDFPFRVSERNVHKSPY
jgi:hypothetical protein